VGVWGQTRSRRTLTGVWRRSTQHLGDLHNFSIKTKHFGAYLDLISAVRNTLTMVEKR